MRRRYIAVEIDSDRTFNEKEFRNAIWSNILRLFGEVGASQTDFTLIDYNQTKSQAILRCSHKALELVKAVIVSVTEIEEELATVHILQISGTLKALRRRVPIFSR